MSILQAKKYLKTDKNEIDLKNEFVINTVGFANINANYTKYPPQGHPYGFNFDIHSGRILDCYQIIYISKGSGKLFIDPQKPIKMSQGDILFIAPDVWHSYFPNKETGWAEYWICAQGKFKDLYLKKAFYSESYKIFNIGVREDLTMLFMKAIQFAEKEKPLYQKVLTGIFDIILGLSLYYEKNKQYENNDLYDKIQQSKALIRKYLLTDVTPQQIAKELNMSYSWFRKLFKQYTNMSPTYYIKELKLKKAKELLASSQMSIKEISYTLNYDNISYFSNLFKKETNMTANEFRKIYGVKKNIQQD